MQPRNPGSFSDPLPNPPRELPGLTKLPPRALAPAAPPSVRPAEPLRVVPAIQFYSRMRPGRLYPLVVKLLHERGGSGTVAPGAFSGPAVRTGLTIQPVIPGATVSPASIAVSAEPGVEARFMVCPAASRSLRLRNARLEFHAHGKLVQSVPTRMRTVRNRLAWLFLILAIVVPCLIAWLRANPMQEFVPVPGVIAAASAPAASTPAPSGSSTRVPTPPESGAERSSSSAAVEKKPGATRPTAAAEKRPGSPASPAGGEGPPRRGGGGMAVQSVHIEMDENSRMPIGPSESLDLWIKKRGQRFWVPSFQVPLDAKEALYAGLYAVKDGFPIGPDLRFPGLVQAYEFVMADPSDQPLGPFQDLIIASGLLLLALLCWLLFGPASRRLTGPVVEVIPALPT